MILNERRLPVAVALPLFGPLILVGSAWLVGCRGTQYGHIISPDKPDLVGSHEAGSEVYNPLIEETVGKLLARQASSFQQVGYIENGPPAPKAICFVGVENHSIEDLGDFKEQIYQQIDTMLVQSEMFRPVSRRWVDAALQQQRLRPDSLMVPDNMRAFSAVMEQNGQPFDYLLFATVTSGTTERNHSQQRDYTLTLELVDVHTGHADKESAEIRKGYHKSRVGAWLNYGSHTQR
ncbi:MAG: penicillin-binding protein activator LpoB [Pirellulales bacterium]